MNYYIALNEKFGSYEVTFTEKPSEAVREALKGLKMRWNGARGFWYGFASKEAIEAAIGGKAFTETKTEPKKVKKSAPLLPLWVRCDVSELIKTSEGKKREYKPIKETAAELRAELKKRFPEVKFSVTSATHGYCCHALDVRIVSAPYELPAERVYTRSWAYSDRDRANNEPLQAIAQYVQSWIDARNYDESDSMTDYFDRGIYEDIAVAYDYTETEASAEIIADLEAYKRAQDTFRAELDEKERKEDERRRAELEKEREEAKKREEEAQKTAEAIKAHVKVADIPAEKHFRIENLRGGIGKECSLEELKNSIAEYMKGTETAEITREVVFTDKTLFDSFCNMFLYDWEFLDGKGGTATDDSRLNDISFAMLNAEQRESVAVYMCDCVAVYLGDELKLIIDPEGYSYARYVFLPEEGASLSPVTVTDTAEGKKPFYFPAPVSEQVQPLADLDPVTIIMLDPWILCTHVLRGSINKITVDYGRKTAQIELMHGRKKQVVHIDNNTTCALFRGYLPDTPEEMQCKYISENMRENLTAGANAHQYIINAIDYYTAEGFTKVIDTIQR